MDAVRSSLTHDFTDRKKLPKSPCVAAVAWFQRATKTNRPLAKVNLRMVFVGARQCLAPTFARGLISIARVLTNDSLDPAAALAGLPMEANSGHKWLDFCKFKC